MSGARERTKNMDFKRITSGFIVGLVLIVILLIPYNIITGLLFTLIAIVGMHEYLGAISKVCKPVKWVAYLSCAVVSIPSFISNQELPKILMYSIPFVLLILFSQVIATDMKTTFKDMAYTLLGICYIPTFLMFLTMIDKMQNGKILLGYIFIASWGTDIFAYCIGKRFGKHKFSKVSPKKSIEGCIAGTIGATILALIYTIILNKGFSFEYSYIIVGILGIVLSLIGQLGDFSASCIKRYVDIKDYSNLLPGHGGMLDRIDSVLFIAPFAYMLFTMI
ncbi:phosphatidate cytidylyltransferase [Clostridium sp. CAG:389]|nr:phosphatidate cytidylyltransferase [Clostridium sp. CAG:389]